MIYCHWFSYSDKILNEAYSYAYNEEGFNAEFPDVPTNRYFVDYGSGVETSNKSATAILNQSIIFEGHPPIPLFATFRMSKSDSEANGTLSNYEVRFDNYEFSDDIINGVAGDPKYYFRLDVETPIHLYAGDVKNIPLSVLSNGFVVDEEINYVSSNSDIVEVQGNKLIGRGIGSCIIECSLNKNKYIKTSIEIDVSAEHVIDTEEYYIDGPDYIEWNTTAEYKLSNEDNCVFEVEYFSNVKHTEEWTDNSILISIKDKYAGNIKITGLYNDRVIEKTVMIKTL